MGTLPIPSYASPPLTEVAVGLTLSPLKLQTRHIGEFWTEIREDYPDTEDNPPIPIQVNSNTFEMGLSMIPPLRRVFMMTPNKEYVIQIQEGRFLHNWRKHPAEATYPRYTVVLEKFLSAWKKFSAFSIRRELGDTNPIGYELTYVNQLDDPAAHGIQEFFKPLDWQNQKPEFLLQPPRATNIAWSLALPESKGAMNVSANRVTQPDGRTALLLVLSCVGPASVNYSIEDWFGTAHEWIVRGFTDLTTPEAHQLWKREA
jgi:uncharacterized protein (TIGR04255 family)